MRLLTSFGVMTLIKGTIGHTNKDIFSPVSPAEAKRRPFNLVLRQGKGEMTYMGHTSIALAPFDWQEIFFD